MSFSRRGRRPHETDYGWRPPTTFVDVLFLILVFFISIAAVSEVEQEQQIDVTLPATATGQSGRRPPTVITVTSDGKIHHGDRDYTLEQLRPVLADLARLAREAPGGEALVIRGDRNSALGVSVQVLDMAHQVGWKNVYLATTKTADEVMRTP